MAVLRRFRPALGVAVVVLSLLTAVASWLTRRTAPPAVDPPLADAQFTRFTDWEGTEGGAEISPDGRFVAFLADRDGQFDLWVSQVGTGRFVNLTSGLPPLVRPGPVVRRLGFSGDGGEIWFGPSTSPGIMLMPITGGTPRAFLSEGANSPSWSPDGTRIVYLRIDSGEPLFIADRTGADAREILAPREGAHNHNPVWWPDGQWIYFVRGFLHGLNQSDDMDVWRIRTSGGSPERLTQQKTAVNFLAPLDLRTLLFVAHAEDQSGPWLWSLDVESKVTRRVSSGLDHYTSVASSRDGRRLVATVAKPSANLGRVPVLDRLAEDSDVEPYPLPTARALAPRFGGTSLFYLSSRGTGDGLWRARDGEALEIRRGADGALSEPPAVSPDGRRVAVVLGKEGQQHLSIMSADGRDSRTLAPSIDTQGTGDWSPDGKWIVVGGRDAQGPALFKIPVDGGAPVRLVGGQAVSPVWSRDGKLIVYAGPVVGGNVPLLGLRPDGSPVELPPVRAFPVGFRFLPSGTGVVYLRGNGEFLDFWLLDLATKTTRQLTRFRNQGDLRAFDVTPDGRFIVFDRSRENSDIVLIDRPN